MSNPVILSKKSFVPARQLMRNLLQRPFFTVFQNEVLLNSKRVAPYVLMLLFIVNAVMWSVRGAAATRGWATILVGMTVFYTGEAMHRDRELKIETVLWSAPISNSVLLLSKFLATLLLGLFLVVVVGVIAIVIQILKGDTPISISAYMITYSVILLPSIVFMSGVSVALNVLLRDKYVAYAVSIGIGAGLFYLYAEGYNHWLYNPVLYQLWNYADLTSAGNKLGTILTHRLYCLAIASACLSLAHLFFQRKSAKRLRGDNRLTGTGWTILIGSVSVAIVVLTGWSIYSSA